MASTGRRIALGCAIAIGGAGLGLFLLVLAFGLWGNYANTRAEKRAAAVCASAHAGEPIEELQGRFAKDDPPPRVIKDGEVYHFHYFGMIFSSRECEVTTVAGRIRSVRQLAFDDD